MDTVSANHVSQTWSEIFLSYQQQVEAVLAHNLPNGLSPDQVGTLQAEARKTGRANWSADPLSALEEALGYVCLAGGKRLRPVLALATAEACRPLMTPRQVAALQDPERLAPLLCALEWIHTYSLVHDDLPCMDDDSLRHGLPTLHPQWGEGRAVLVGDALLTRAAQALNQLAQQWPDVRCGLAAQAVVLACAERMVQGQWLDLSLEAQEKPQAFEENGVPAGANTGLEQWRDAVESVCDQIASGAQNPDFSRTNQSALGLSAQIQMMAYKTAALLQAPVLAVVELLGLGPSYRTPFAEWALHLGLAFQLRDDLLDVEASAAVLGKTPGKDDLQQKATIGGQRGWDFVRACLEQETQAAHAALTCLKEQGVAVDFLADLTQYLMSRTH